MGDRVYLERVIKRLEDWERIKPLDVYQGTYGWHLLALREVMKAERA